MLKNRNTKVATAQRRAVNPSDSFMAVTHTGSQ